MADKRPEPSGDIIDEIISELRLHENVAIANMDENEVRILQGVLNRYIREKIGTETADKDYTKLLEGLWKRLKETHKIRAVK